MGRCASKVSHKLKNVNHVADTSLKPNLLSDSMPKNAHNSGCGSTRAQSLSQTTDILSSSPPASPSQRSRLEEPQRRRLSVSTVSRDGEESHDDDTLPNSCALSPKSYRFTQQSSVSQLHKFPDPALELVDMSTGEIRDVTVQGLADLLRETSSSVLLFGSPTYGSQRGFDNKKQEAFGDPSRLPGVGFACKKGLKPESPNQDDFFIFRVDDWAMYGVFDGHGPYGHEVSSFAHRVLPFLILSDPSFETDPLKVMKQSFRKVHHLLEGLTESTAGHRIDSSLSGTTATVVLHRGGKLFVAHVGDSRSVLATKNGRHAKAINLTTDHKPTQPVERTRIEASGGEVRRLEGDIPHRVFVKYRYYPGLAMSRALGDTVGAAIGVIPDPDTRVVDITSDMQFMVLATDGVWEFLSSQDVVDCVYQQSRSDAQGAAAQESWKRWLEEEEHVVDDITCIVVWF